MKQNITQVAGHRRVKVGPWKVMVDFIGSRPSTLRVQIMRRVSPTNMKVVPSTEIVNIYIFLVLNSLSMSGILGSCST